MTDMKYTAFDIDWKARKFRVGSCVAWAIAIVCLVWSGHLLLATPIAIPVFWKWLRGG
jgi:hypothetical protein